MVRLGGTATVSHMDVFQGLEKLFRQQGIELDWVLYSGYDEMVDAFVKGEIDLAWNGPLSYVKIKRQVADAPRAIARCQLHHLFHYWLWFRHNHRRRSQGS